MSNLSKFLPTAEMQAEFEQYKLLKTDTERAEFQELRAQHIEQLPAPEREAYQTATVTGLNATIQAAENEIIAYKLGAISQAVSLSYIAKTYFGKSKEWLYQRINGYNVNGKPAQFSTDEKIKFAAALQDLSVQLQETSLKFV